MSSASNKDRKPGRPTLGEQIKMKAEVYRLLGRGLSAAYVIEKTGFDKDTVYSYRREYFQLLEQEEDGKSVSERNDEERFSARIVLDRLTDYAFEVLEFVRNEMNNSKKKNEKPDKYYLNVQLETITTIEKLQADYRALALIPDSKQLAEEIKRELKKKKRYD